jgi:hypothetical protein
MLNCTLALHAARCTPAVSPAATATRSAARSAAPASVQAGSATQTLAGTAARQRWALRRLTRPAATWGCACTSTRASTWACPACQVGSAATARRHKGHAHVACACLSLLLAQLACKRAAGVELHLLVTRHHLQLMAGAFCYAVQAGAPSWAR